MDGAFLSWILSTLRLLCLSFPLLSYSANYHPTHQQSSNNNNSNYSNSNYSSNNNCICNTTNTKININSSSNNSNNGLPTLLPSLGSSYSNYSTPSAFAVARCLHILLPPPYKHPPHSFLQSAYFFSFFHISFFFHLLPLLSYPLLPILCVFLFCFAPPVP